MKAIKQFQVRGIPGEVVRISIGDRIIDYWAPQGPRDTLLIAHDGQNIFDGKTSTHRRKTWEIGQSVNRVSTELGMTPPAVIAIWNGNSKEDPWARIKELAPEKVLRGGVKVITSVHIPVTVDQLYGDKYLTEIFSTIIPELVELLEIDVTPEKTAMIGSSMGGLCTLNAVAEYADTFHTALSLSTHWPLGGDPLVDALIGNLPTPGKHSIYMSHGTKGLDAEYGPFQKRADDLIAKKGYRQGADLLSRVHPRTGHNEKSWASFIDEPISFWLKRLAI
ncbi:MAG: hypothetical protein RIR99_333 [Actinomycetota bacterium]|jgi:hypothetical protein